MNLNPKFSSIEQMVGQINSSQGANSARQNLKRPVTKNEGLSFQEVLQKTEAQGETAADHLRFSKHASQRLEQREIALTTEQLARLNQGADKARAKGIKESLVMVDDLAFIINVPNNTVITAVNPTDQGVFTNIDGAVIG